MSVLRQPELCDHNNGIVITDQEVTCADCGTEMVWMSRRYLDSLHRDPTQRERDLQQALTVKNAALLRIRQNLMEAGIW